MTTFSNIIIITLSLVSLLSFALPAHAVMLRTITTVDGDHVTLGDLFEGVNSPQNIVGKSPRLGKEMVINAKTLSSIAQKYQVGWTPASELDQVVVRRASYTIVADDVITALKDKIGTSDKGGETSITLNDTNISFVLPASVDPTIEITSLNYSQNRDVFTADIAIPNKQNPIITKRITGMVTRTVSLPVLNKTMKKTDVISMNDIEYTNIPERTLLPNAVLDADDLIGMSPSRVITAGRVIKDNDVGAPQLVKRGQDVTVEYQGAGGMVLTAKGKAMQNGAKGDFIKITNSGSTKQITAEVTGDRAVMVQ